MRPLGVSIGFIRLDGAVQIGPLMFCSPGRPLIFASDAWVFLVVHSHGAVVAQVVPLLIGAAQVLFCCFLIEQF